MLAGHSFGGMVAGEVLVRHPEAARGAIFISSAGWLDPVNALTPTPYFLVNRVGIWITGMEFFGRRMLKALGVNPYLVSRQDRKRLQKGWRKAYEMARMGPFYHSPNFADRVLSSNKPVAIIHGGRDILFPLPRVQEIVAGRAPLWVIEESGHVPFLSQPRAFSSVFREAFRHVVGFPQSEDA